MPARLPTVSIVGAGTLGSLFARELSGRGYPIASIINRTGRTALALAKSVKCRKASTQISDIDPRTQIILIAVSDDAVAETASRLATLKTLRHRTLFAAHCSGVHSADALRPLRLKGATVASIHPIQTFPAARSGLPARAKLSGIYFGVDADRKALPQAEALVRALGGTPVVIPAELKPLYHVACVFASNYLMVHLGVVDEIARKLSLRASWSEVFGPLIATSMGNVVKRPLADALTGPIVRGDIATIDRHLDALAAHAPEFLPLYTVAGLNLGRIARDKGKISAEAFDNLVARFKAFVTTLPVKTNRKAPR